MNQPRSAPSAIRDQARHLIVDPDFGFDELLISTTEPRVDLAAALLDLLLKVACTSSERELNDYAVGPMGLTNADVEWRQDKVRRPTAAGSVDLLTHVLVVHTAVAGLSAAAIHQALERLQSPHTLAAGTSTTTCVLGSKGTDEMLASGTTIRAQQLSWSTKRPRVRGL